MNTKIDEIMYQLWNTNKGLSNLFKSVGESNVRFSHHLRVRTHALKKLSNFHRMCSPSCVKLDKFLLSHGGNVAYWLKLCRCIKSNTITSM